MRDLLYSTKTILDGPWLLTAKDLKELDGILSERWIKLEKRRKKYLDLDTENIRKKYENLDAINKEQAKKEIKVYKNSSIFSKKLRRLHLYYKDDSSFICESFSEALNALPILKKKPVGFGIDILSGDIRCQVSTDWINSNIEIEVQPESEEISRELFTAICDWAGDIRRREYINWTWGKLAGSRLKIILIGIVIFGLMIFSSQYSETENIREQLTYLFSQGITDSNILDTVRLLTSLQINKSFPSWVGKYMLGFIYVMLILFIHPKIVIGIGKGKDYLLYWKIWQAIIIGTPAAVLSYIEIYPYVKSSELFRILQNIGNTIP